VVHPSTTIEEAADLMKSLDVGPLPVCDGERLIGMLTDRDIVVRAVAHGLSPEAGCAGEVCSRKLVTVSPDDGEWYAVELMRLNAVRRLPVVDNERPVGVLSLGDLAIDLDGDSTLATISAAPPNK